MEINVICIVISWINTHLFFDQVISMRNEGSYECIQTKVLSCTEFRCLNEDRGRHRNAVRWCFSICATLFKVLKITRGPVRSMFQVRTLHHYKEHLFENQPKKSTISPISSVGIQSPIVVSFILDSTLTKIILVITGGLILLASWTVHDGPSLPNNKVCIQG